VCSSRQKDANRRIGVLTVCVSRVDPRTGRQLRRPRCQPRTRMSWSAPLLTSSVFVC
jgi:hypothetical protein